MNDLQLVLRDINEGIESLHEQMALGAAKDFGEYRNICGKLHGLTTAKNIVTDRLKKLELENAS